MFTIDHAPVPNNPSNWLIGNVAWDELGEREEHKCHAFSHSYQISVLVKSAILNLWNADSSFNGHFAQEWITSPLTAVYLGRAWGTPTLAWLYWACVWTYLCLFVCLFVWTDHLLQISSRRLILHTSREQLSECSVVGNPERRRLKLKHAGSLYVCVCVCFYKLSQLRTMQTNFTANYLWTVMTHSGWSCFSYLRHSRDSAHDLFSPCMCSHSSCPDWQRTVTNPVAIYVLCAMTIAITMCCLLRLAPWCWSIFLHAVVVPLVFALDFSGVPLYYSTIPFTSYNRWIECLVCCQDNRTWTPVTSKSWMDLYACLVTLTGWT